MIPESEAVPGLRPPYPRLVDVAGIVGKVDTADGIMLIGDIAGKHANLEVSDRVAITGPEPTFKLCSEGKLNTFIKEITGLAFQLPVSVQE